MLIVEGKDAYEVLKRCHDLFPEWQDEGHQFWNSETGEIIQENGLTLHDGVYRGYRNYNDYWKDPYNDGPGSFNGHSDLSITLNDDQDILAKSIVSENINAISV